MVTWSNKAYKRKDKAKNIILAKGCEVPIAQIRPQIGEFLFQSKCCQWCIPLCKVTLPWRLYLQSATPNSYSACEILIRTEVPITILGGNWFNWRSQWQERACANDFPVSGGFSAVITAGSMEAKHAHSVSFFLIVTPNWVKSKPKWPSKW